MSTFTALNIIPDDHPDDEIDNTKELQIEEALKLYQTALKLHSQGPALYSEAARAYTNLFQSEIFKYPESETEFVRFNKESEVEFTEASYSLGLDLAAAAAEASPSTLPQILYLSYKNHGQFILDCVKGLPPDAPLAEHQLDYQGRAAIRNFSLALASDESDTELWRRTARIGAMLGSRRIARYCLEAALEVDEDPTIAEVDPSSLEEGFAGEQLKQQLQVLGDDTALSHPIMAPFLKKTMPNFLLKQMDPYPFLPDSTASLQIRSRSVDVPSTTSGPLVVKLQSRSWTGLGEKLCEAYLSPKVHGSTKVVLELPPKPINVADDDDVQQETPTPVVDPATEDQVMKDAEVSVSPLAEDSEAVAEPPATSDLDQPVNDTEAASTSLPTANGEQPMNVSLPTRKRSQSAAGVQEALEDENGAQKRSKRIRSRYDATLDTPIGISRADLFAEQLKHYVDSDEIVFSFVSGLLIKLGVEDLGTLSGLQQALKPEGKGDRTESITNTAVRDLRDILRTWDDAKASTFVNGNAADILGSSASNANAGLAAFLEHSKTSSQRLSSIPSFADDEGLSRLSAKLDREWMPLQDVIWEWLCAILPTYRTTKWAEALKVKVVNVISFADSDIFERLQAEIVRSGNTSEYLEQLEDMVQTLFELHVDIYSRITNPTSVVPYETRIEAKDRLDRWVDVAADIVHSGEQKRDDDLTFRYLWASVFYATMAESASREHKVLCWSDLQALLREGKHDTIELQNNAVMPEISIEAAEREVSRLTTMDFFAKLFQTDTSDPLAIIETLEPVLDPESASENSEPEDTGAIPSVDPSNGTPAALHDMWKFLKSGSTSLRLFLWQRLREAYSSIGYNTKVFSCHLRSIEIIVNDMRSESFVDSAEDARQHQLLLWLKALDDLLVKALTIALNDAATCFEIIDERHIKSTCSALAQLSRVLHTAAIYDDEIRVGMAYLPHTPAYGGQGSFESFNNKLRQMQVRTWALQYTMIKEATTQNQEIFTTPETDLADYLSYVHYSLGLRKCCKASNKIFLKMMKVEMIRLKHVDKWADYLGQVLYDLYGLQLGVGTFLLQEHGCTTEQLDRRTVLNIAEQVIALANNMPMKDLLKHELRATLERMQMAVGATKSSPQMQHNLRNYTELLKTSIRPADLYKAWKGQVQVDSLPVVTPESPLADKNWYFLMGMVNLTKFRSQKRLGPGSQVDDLRVAATFLRLQLQFSADYWETWYRLAQCFDHELEEEVLWSADKINNHRPDLVGLQRSSIHCYTMSLSTAFRTADDKFDTAEKLSEMYHDFGMRIYSASREPFTMEAFWVDEFEKHMSGAEGMYKKPLHDELSRYRAWHYAAKLFRESLQERPNFWMNHYMLGKCLWKMYCRVDEDWDPKVRATKPSIEAVLKAFTNAVKSSPKQNSSRAEPLLEPHYKIVAVVHKLVLMQAMTPQAGADLLQAQPMAIDKGEAVVFANPQEWEPYILKTLRHLKAADKQHWQHRIVARLANIAYDDEHPDYAHAQVARDELKDSIFTRMMHIQVWKVEAERAGRHCVYMERYVRLMSKLLLMTDDKPSMDLLVRRVRKKGNDFFRFDKIWADCCTTYLRMIRRTSGVQSNLEDVFKGIGTEEFDSYSDRLGTWMSIPQISHPALDALKEASELRKLNANLMKPTPIDDLINDAYATLYTQVAKNLPDPDPASLSNAQKDGESPAMASVRAFGPMSLGNLVMDMNGTQIPVPITIAGAETARPRKLGISRKEVLRRAEMVVSRIPDPPRAVVQTSRPRLSEPAPSLILGSNDGATKQRRSISAAGSTPRVQTPVAQPDQDQDQDQDQDTNNGHEGELEEQEGQDEQGEHGGEAEQEQDEGSREEKNDEESERGSVHDSADDESDLSDPPDIEDIDSSVLFPGLMIGSEAGSGSTRAEEQGDEEGDEEGGEDEDEDEEEGGDEEVGEGGSV